MPRRLRSSRYDTHGIIKDPYSYRDTHPQLRGLPVPLIVIPVEPTSPRHARRREALPLLTSPGSIIALCFVFVSPWPGSRTLSITCVCGSSRASFTVVNHPVSASRPRSVVVGFLLMVHPPEIV